MIIIIIIIFAFYLYMIKELDKFQFYINQNNTFLLNTLNKLEKTTKENLDKIVFRLNTLEDKVYNKVNYRIHPILGVKYNHDTKVVFDYYNNMKIGSLEDENIILDKEEYDEGLNIYGEYYHRCTGFILKKDTHTVIGRRNKEGCLIPISESDFDILYAWKSQCFNIRNKILKNKFTMEYHYRV